METALWKVILLSFFSYSAAFEFSFDGQPNIAGISKNYDRNFRPNYGAVADMLSISIDSLSIRGIDEMGSKVIVDLSLRTSWTDPRLVDAVNRTTTFVGSLPSIWFPPLFIVDASDETFGSSMLIKPEGEVVLTERHIADVHCQFSFIKLPFDTQDCGIRLKTQAFSTLHLDMVWNGRIMESNVKVYDSQFSLNSITQSSDKETEMGGEFRVLTAGIKLKRNPFRHFKLIMIPGIIFTILAYLTLFLKEHSNEGPHGMSFRIGLIRTIFCVTIFSVYQILTQIYYTSATGVALTACDIWIFMASAIQLFLFVFNFIILVNVNHSGQPHREEKRQPCLHRFGKILTTAIPIGAVVFLIIYFLVFLI